MAFPGILTRGQFATGLQTQSICVNGDYLLVESCDINQTQELDINYYVQGGPAASIYNLGAKKYEGSISFPLRVDKNGILEPAARTLLTYAARPMTALRIDTHHVLSHFNATATNPGSDTNQLLSLDSVVINNLSVKTSDGGPVSVTLSVMGMVDAGTGSTFNINENALQGRVLSFAECNVFRKESSMRTTSEFEITVENELITPVFLMPYYAGAGAVLDSEEDLVVPACPGRGRAAEDAGGGIEAEPGRVATDGGGGAVGESDPVAERAAGNRGDIRGADMRGLGSQFGAEAGGVEPLGRDDLLGLAGTGPRQDAFRGE